MTLPFRSGTQAFTEAEREREASAERERVLKGVRRRKAMRSRQRYDQVPDPKLADLYRRMVGERDE